MACARYELIAQCLYGEDEEAVVFRLDGREHPKMVNVRCTAAGDYTVLLGNLMQWLLPYRQLEGKIAMSRAAVKVSEDLRKKGIIKSWENDIMRHSFCSYLLAKDQNIGLVAEQAGNSPEMIKKHYSRPLTQEEGEAWFEIRPKLAADENAEVA